VPPQLGSAPDPGTPSREEICLAEAKTCRELEVAVGLRLQRLAG
jgi:hypothetical protein